MDSLLVLSRRRSPAGGDATGGDAGRLGFPAAGARAAIPRSRGGECRRSRAMPWLLSVRCPLSLSDSRCLALSWSLSLSDSRAARSLSLSRSAALAFAS